MNRWLVLLGLCVVLAVQIEARGKGGHREERRGPREGRDPGRKGKVCKIVVNEETTFEKQCPLAGVGLQECKPPALDERRRSRRKVKHLCVEKACVSDSDCPSFSSCVTPPTPVGSGRRRGPSYPHCHQTCDAQLYMRACTLKMSSDDTVVPDSVHPCRQNRTCNTASFETITLDQGYKAYFCEGIQDPRRRCANQEREGGRRGGGGGGGGGGRGRGRGRRPAGSKSGGGRRRDRDRQNAGHI